MIEILLGIIVFVLIGPMVIGFLIAIGMVLFAPGYYAAKDKAEREARETIRRERREQKNEKEK